MGEKRYKIWIEVEEWDIETDEYTTIDGMSFSSTAEFSTLEKAEEFAFMLHSMGGGS